MSMLQETSAEIILAKSNIAIYIHKNSGPK
jgi:hypothetical protein